MRDNVETIYAAVWKGINKRLDKFDQLKGVDRQEADIFNREAGALIAALRFITGVIDEI